MSLTEIRPAAEPGVTGAPASPVAPVGRSLPRHWFALTLAALALLSFGMHLFRLDQSYELFVDESFYAQVGQSVGHGHMPAADGSLFFLHPPGFFLIEAAWMHLFGFHHSVFAQVWSLRKLNALFDAGAVALVGLIVGRIVSRRAGLLAACLFMINAFVNFESSMVMLEPSSIFWALLGFAVLQRVGGSSRRWWLVVGAGISFGMSVLCKEFGFFITFVPAVVMYVGGRVLRRTELLRASECGVLAALSVVPYLIWTVIVAATGHWGSFWAQVTSGFRRAVGTKQVTGFNSAHSPSFLQTLVKDLSPLFSAYVILALGSLAIVYLVWKGTNPSVRLVGYFGLGALPLTLYCMTIGTNEEQFFDFLIAPALICFAVALTERWGHVAEDVRTLALIVLAAVVVSDVANYAVLRVSSDYGTYKVDRWMAAHVPPSTTVAVTNSVQREIFKRYNMVDDRNGTTELPAGARYLVVFYREVDEGYAFVDRSTIDRQVGSLAEVYSTTDNSNGQMVVYAAGAPPR